ncbi:MAG: 1-acyl-sn-glycerol-3-phosphate acyltransferase [Acidobacteria bacterium]|nr:1-acyl-sn-glycerol-3-phosphate acyltransferase [Acidobacteriota bacterium]
MAIENKPESLQESFAKGFHDEPAIMNAHPLEQNSLATLAVPVAKFPTGIGLGVALGAAAVGAFVIFKLMNRLKVYGLENIPIERENVLYCPNHSSLLDSFAFEYAAYIPKAFLQPDYLPVSLVDRKNFFGDPASRRLKDKVLAALGNYFFKQLRAYPVDRNRRDLGQVDQWIELLKKNIVIVFPEGTRSRTGNIGTGKAGVGKLIYEARPMVIPVRIVGTEDVLGVGKFLPRMFRTVHLMIGKPLDLSDLLNRPMPAGDSEEGQRDFYRAISGRVVQAIQTLMPEG